MAKKKPPFQKKGPVANIKKELRKSSSHANKNVELLNRIKYFGYLIYEWLGL